MDFNSSVQTISWFRDRYREGSLQIRPPYQRKPVWVAKQKCYLIESILMELPVPEIYIQQVTTPNGDTTFAIVDGQQRIRTILQFIGVESDISEQEYNQFILDKLKSSSPWRNYSFSNLTDEDKKKFYSYKFAVRYLNTDSNDEVRNMFERLNTYLTPLKPQELRNATYSGPLVKLASTLADIEFWSENHIVTPASIRRMGDVEFVSELIIGVLHGPQGGGAAIIDNYYKQYEDYEDEFPDQKRAQRLFDETLNVIKKILLDIKETRWSNKSDFYTLFVTLASLLRTGDLPDSAIAELRKSLNTFADDIDQFRSDENTQVSKDVTKYLEAVEKGANDKKRRADRQAAMIKIIGHYFKLKK